MSVFVDDMLLTAKVRGARRARWSHLFADTSAELRDFARVLGMRPEWIQHPGTHREHFDVTATLRAVALDLGAEPITYPAGVAELLMARRQVCRCWTLRECRWPNRSLPRLFDGPHGECEAVGEHHHGWPPRHGWPARGVADLGSVVS